MISTDVRSAARRHIPRAAWLALLVCVLALVPCAPALANSPVIIGLTGGSSNGKEDSTKFKEDGLTSERLNANDGEAAINRSLEYGWSNPVVMVGNTQDTEPLRTINVATWTETALAQVKWLAARGITLLEVGNEMYLKGPRCTGCYQQKEPAKYAEMFVSLSRAVEEAKISGVKLLFNSYGDYQEREGGGFSCVCGGRGWLGDALKAQPELKKRIADFTMHPYGEKAENSANDLGPQALYVEHKQAVELGFEHTDYYVTEFGVELEAPGPEGSKSPEDQAERIRGVYEELIGFGFVKGIWYYGALDNSTGKWGLIEPQPTETSPFVPRPALGVVSSFAKQYNFPTPEIVEYPVPYRDEAAKEPPHETEVSLAYPAQITTGPDGNLWATAGMRRTPLPIGKTSSYVGGKLLKITPFGGIHEYTLPEASQPTNITPGPDGNMWFTDRTGKIDKFSTQTNRKGETTEYSLPEGAKPYDITQGPDGNLWFTEDVGGHVGKITTSGSITSYEVPEGSEPEGIAKGPDGNLWYVEHGTGYVVKITTTGAKTEYKLPSGSAPTDVTEGPDGNLWFTEQGTSRVGKITTGGTKSEYSVGEGSEPTAITQGADGNLWYLARGTNKVGKITTTGTSTEYELPGWSSRGGITAGPDGNLWYTRATGLPGLNPPSSIAKLSLEVSKASPAAYEASPFDLASPPTGSAAPSLSGTPQQEKPFGESHGTWTNEPTSYSYQWLRCNSGGSGCTSIAGATAGEYRPVGADVGRTLKLEERASNSGGASTAEVSAASAIVVHAAPLANASPAVSGSAQVGQSLSTSTGEWANEPSSYSYQWERCSPAGVECANISGATSSSYSAAEGDLEHTLAVRVTATNAYGSTATTSAVTGQITGLLLGNATSTYSVADQTTVGREEAFQFTAAITGKIEELRFRTNATANTGITSVVLGVFADSSGKPGAVLGQITATGEPATNTWVKATGLSVNVTSGTKYWLVVLPRGTSGKQLHYNAAASSGGTGNVESVAGGLSALTEESSWETYNQGPVGFQAIGIKISTPAPTNTAPPTISGTAQVGQTLSAATGTWANEPTGYSYQWQRCNAAGGECANISGATASSYTVAEADLEHTLTVKVTATNEGGSGSANSAVTAQVTGLLVGDATATYSVSDQTTIGREEAFQSTAPTSGKVEELRFRTNATANPGVSSVVLGVFADSSGKPGAVLGQATVSGEPATSSCIKATGLSVGVTSGTKYWLVVLPLGTSGKQLHYNVAVSSGGTGNVESVAGGLGTLTEESSWETYNQGPVGFQATGP